MSAQCWEVGARRLKQHEQKAEEQQLKARRRVYRALQALRGHKEAPLEDFELKSDTVGLVTALFWSLYRRD